MIKKLLTAIIVFTSLFGFSQTQIDLTKDVKGVLLPSHGGTGNNAGTVSYDKLTSSPGKNQGILWTGTGNPSSTLGNDGDYYLNNYNMLFGPKANGAWPTNGTYYIPSENSNGAVNLPGVCNASDGSIDVMACYGAKGDCVTDDHNAILAALTAAYNSTPIRAVFFSRPPGGCYLTSTLPWLGVSLIGVPNGIGNQVQQRISEIRGKPGQDIFNFGDPNTVASSTPHIGYVVRDIEFIVDDSVDASSSHPNRKLGRTIANVSMTSGSAIVTATQGEFSQGDVGQPTSVSNVGSAGSTLTSTIVSVQSPTQATLGVTASTSSTSSTTMYVSIANLPVTQTVGNCAFAVDNKDGNTANWISNPNSMNTNSLWEDVSIYPLAAPTFAGRNNVCGIYFQPAGMPYNQVWRDSIINYMPYAFVGAAPNTVNPGMGNGVGADYFQWYGGVLGGTFPFIMYNGGDSRIDQVQICAVNKPEILQTYSAVETFPGYYHVHIPEDECQTTSGAGWRLEGRDHHFEQTELGGISGSTIPVMWDATNSTCKECDATNIVQINGNLNTINFVERGEYITLVDNGYGNNVRGSLNYGGQSASANRHWAKSAMREETVGNKHNDFINRGLGNMPYNNDTDMWLWPSDFSGIYGGGTGGGVVIKDSTSDSGQYMPFFNGGGFNININFTQINGLVEPNQNFAPTIGTVIPPAKVTAYIKGKCPTSETITGTVYAVTSTSGQTAVGTISGSCTSSYGVVAAVPMDLTSYAGQTLSFNLGLSSEFDIAWVAIRPWNGDLLVNGPVQHWSSSGAYIGTEAQPTLTSNRNWTWPDMSGTVGIMGANLPGSFGTITQYDLCGSLLGTDITCSYNPETIVYPPSGSTLTGSTVTFSWTPAVGSTSYYVHLGTTAGGMDLVNAGASNATSYTAYGIPTSGNTVYLTIVPVTGIGGQATATYTEATAVTPLMNGTAAVGTSLIPAKADHVHPTDTTRAGNGVCGTNLFEIGDTSSGPNCAQVNWSQLSGVPALPFPVITYPPPGTALPGATITFSWTPIGTSTSYYVHVGSTLGGVDIVNVGPITGTSYTATIPTLGSTIYLDITPTTGTGSIDATYTEATSTYPNVQANSVTVGGGVATVASLSSLNVTVGATAEISNWTLNDSTCSVPGASGSYMWCACTAVTGTSCTAWKALTGSSTSSGATTWPPSFTGLSFSPAAGSVSSGTTVTTSCTGGTPYISCNGTTSVAGATGCSVTAPETLYGSCQGSGYFITGSSVYTVASSSGCNGSSPSSCVFRETFDGSAACWSGSSNTNCLSSQWVNTFGGSSIVYNYATAPAPFQGSYSLELLSGADVQSAAGSITGATYVGMEYYFTTFADYLDHIQILNSTGAELCGVKMSAGGTQFTVTNSGGSNASSSTGIATSTKYYLQLQAVAGTGSNAVCTLYYSTTGTSGSFTAVSSTNGTWTTAPNYLDVFGSNTGTDIVDDIRASTSIINWN